MTYPLHDPVAILDYGSKCTYSKNNHTGIDLVSNSGNDDIFATRSGYVVEARASDDKKGADPDAWGNYIIIDADGGSYSIIYAHLAEILVSKGQYVNRRDKIGIMGNTGGCRRKLLHYEVRLTPWEHCNSVDPSYSLKEEN